MPLYGQHGHKFIGAVRDAWQMFSDDSDDYEVGAPIGFGATSIVYAARYFPKNGSTSSDLERGEGIPVAVKVVDLDKLPQASLRLLRRETQLMSLSKHPNVLRVRGSWMTGHKLYIALRLMNAGSVADIMRYGWPGGMEEEVVKCILKQALEGLNYLHINGFIHRDVKAANMLVDDDGTVLMGDLGVSASLCDDESHPTPSGKGQMTFERMSGATGSKKPVAGPSAKKLGKRKSFVGTPCWMAPELISGKQYDAKADIWSFGITAIELTQGRAPRSRETPQRVLLKTVQEAAPEFSRENSEHKFSKQFKDIVESCLLKDPSKRPSAAELLESSFFKSAKKKGYLISLILKDLPPLTQRQERQILPNKLAKNTTSRSSMSSWDFTLELPNAPPGLTKRHSQNSAHSTLFYHPPVTQSINSISRRAPEERSSLSRAADFPLESLAAHEQDVDIETDDIGRDLDQDGLHSSSAESSVFELSDATNPGIEPSSVGGSSMATTPISCSPTNANDTPLSAKGQPASFSGVLKQGSISNTSSNSTDVLLTSRTGFARNLKASGNVTDVHSVLDKSLAHRRTSSPSTSAPARSSLLSLRRITSATGSFTTSGPPPPGDSPEGMPKESKWKRMVRMSTSSKPPNASSLPPGASVSENAHSSSLMHPGTLKEHERRKSTLGRILEKTGR